MAVLNTSNEHAEAFNDPRTPVFFFFFWAEVVIGNQSAKVLSRLGHMGLSFLHF